MDENNKFDISVSHNGYKISTTLVTRDLHASEEEKSKVMNAIEADVNALREVKEHITGAIVNILASFQGDLEGQEGFHTCKSFCFKIEKDKSSGDC